MTGKQFFYLLWTTGFILFYVLIGTFWTNDRIYSGTKIEFTRSNIELVVTGDNVIVSLDSEDPFVIFQGNKIINGKLLVLPSGERFVAEDKISSGQWTVKSQTVSYTFTSEDPITISVIHTDRGEIWWVMFLLCFLCWVFGMAVAAMSD